MIEKTNNNVYVLWLIDKRERLRFDPTVYQSASDCLNAGERVVENGQASDYTYSIVKCPEFARPRIFNKLTTPVDDIRIEL